MDALFIFDAFFIALFFSEQKPRNQRKKTTNRWIREKKDIYALWD
jgi:hypothetical protein